MNLKTFGSFVAGGTIKPREKGNSEQRILANHAYVEYFIPNDHADTRPPIILTHNYFGANAWLTNVDGKEGWAQFFVRQGFPVFIIDPPGTGRAGFDPDSIDQNASVIDGAFPVDQGFWPGQDTSAWTAWNMGPEWAVTGDGTVQGNQMPTYDEAQRRLLSTLTPNLPVPETVLDDTFIDVLEAVNRMTGPAIFIAWSMGGGMGQRLALRRPELFSGLVLLDGYSGERRFPEPGNWFDNGAIADSKKLAVILSEEKISVLNLNSAAGHYSNTGNARKLGMTLVDQIIECGGSADDIWLPDVGIHGNGHMMFFERNSDQVAGVVADWIKRKYFASR